MGLRRGSLLAYWEQGRAGRIAFAFQPDDSDRPIFLENGQRLTILDENGSTPWTGTIKYVSIKLWDRHRLDAGIWADFKQANVSYADWMAWFWHQPLFQAQLEISL